MKASELPAWIQAGSGTVQAVAAIVLWLITAKYVRLTNALSATADKQLNAMLAAQDAERRATLREFSYLAKRIADMVRAFPLSNSIHDYGGLIVRGALWSDEDVHQLARLAARAGNEFADASVQPLIDLGWLRQRIERIKEAWPNTGLEINSTPWQEWYDRHQRTLSTLDDLHYRANVIAAAITAPAI